MLEHFNNVDNLWHNFLAVARVYCESNEVYSSPVEGASYKIETVQNNVILLRRIEAGTTETIGKQKFLTAIEHIKKLLPKIPKGKVYDHVIEETTLVMLLPMLDWSEDGKCIVVNTELISGMSDSTIIEANPDNINSRVWRLHRIRSGQVKFRFNLQRVYGIQCVISKCATAEVLHACHINPHYIAGDNRTTNGFLLRADLHELFDLNLIAINPNTLTVSVSKKLADSEYWKFQDISISERRDGRLPDKDSLIERWRIFKESN